MHALKSVSMLRPFFLGSIVGSFFCILNVIISLRIGLGYAGTQVAALLGFVGLTLTGKYDKRENNLLQATSSGATLAMFTIDSAFASIILYTGITPLPYLIFSLVLVGALLGILFGMFLRNSLIEEENLPYPGGVATAEVIKSFATIGGQRFKLVLIGSVIGTLVTFPVFVLRVLPSTFPGKLMGLPTFLGLALSPMMIGLGFLMGWKSGRLIFAGSLFSFVIWMLPEQSSVTVTFSKHLSNPWILSVGVFMSVGYAVFSLIITRRTFSLALEKYVTTKRVKERTITLRRLSWLIIFLMVVAISLYSLNQEVFLMFSVFLMSIPLLFVCAAFSGRAMGETGLAPVTSMGILALFLVSFFTHDLASILLFGALVAVVGSSAATLLNTYRIGSIINVKPRKLTLVQALGSIVGAVVGTSVIYALASMYGFGTEAFPAPIAISWGTVASALSKGSLPASINPVIGMSAVGVAGLMTFLKLSAISLSVGILIPPSYSSMIFFGSLLQLSVRKKYSYDKEIQKTKLTDGQSIAAGLITGESLMILVSLVLRSMGM